MIPIVPTPSNIPLVFNLYLTRRCNLDCPYCFVGANQHKSNEVLDMPDDLKDRILQYIEKQNRPVQVTLTGGDIGCLDSKAVLDFAKRIKSLPNVTMLRAESNMVYKLDDNWLNLYALADDVTTSYDYIRLNTPGKRFLWFSNVRKLNELGCIRHCYVTITKKFIELISPEALLDIMLALGIEYIFICRVYIANVNKPNILPLMATNAEQNEWEYRLFLAYEKLHKYNPRFEIEFFESMKETLNGKAVGDFARQCNQTLRTFYPNGDICLCDMCNYIPVDNLYGKTDHLLSPADIADLIKEEANPAKIQRCMSCKHFSYCRGACYNQPHDSTDCAVPHKVFDYLNAERELLND